MFKMFTINHLSRIKNGNNTGQLQNNPFDSLALIYEKKLKS